MSQNSPSHNLEEILAGYVLGDLNEAELIWLNEQLKIDPQLQAQIVQLQTTLTLMPYGLPEDVPKIDLRGQILTKAQTRSTKKSLKKSFSYFPALSRSWVVSAIALFSMLWLGANNFSLRQQLATKETQLEQRSEFIALLHQPNNRLVTFKGLDNVVTASGSLLISPEKQKAVLALQNIESLPGKQVYRLWAVSQKNKTGCANFTPNEQGIVHLELSSDGALMNASSIFITIEPEADTQKPLGSEFLTGSETTI